MKKFMFLVLLLTLSILVLSGCESYEPRYCNQEGSPVNTSEITRDHSLQGLETQFSSIEGLFRAVYSFGRSPGSWTSYIIRIKVLSERTEYMDTAHFGQYLPHTIKQVQVIDTFFGEVDTGSVIEIRIPPSLISPIGIGDDAVLFLAHNQGREGNFPVLIQSFQSAYRIPPSLAYPQSIISSILTRTISEDIILEPLSPHNNLVLTVQDLARIAGLCDSPWPQPVIYRTVTFTPNANQALLPGFIPTGGMVRANTNPYQILPRGRITIGAEGEPIESGSSHREETEITFRATPDRGASLQAWYINGIRYTGGTPNSITLTLEANLDVRAVFGVVGGS